MCGRATECLVDHARPVPRRLPVARRAPGRAHAEPRPARRERGAPRRHYSQAAPCGPGRAALYTGMYQMNNRVVANGTPLDDRFDNVALARPAGRLRAGAVRLHRPGASTHATSTGPDDPRLRALRGRAARLRRACSTCPSHVHAVARVAAPRSATTSPGDRPRGARDRARAAGGAQHVGVPDRPRCSTGSAARTSRGSPTLSYLRPHPPYSAAGRVGARRTTRPTSATRSRRSPIASPLPRARAAPSRRRRRRPTPTGSRQLRAQYFGMISEVDDQLGRLWDALQRARRSGTTR